VQPGGERTETVGKEGMSMEKAVLRVDGMTCSHCKMAVEKALKNVPGVSGAVVDLAAKTATVDYEPGRATPAGLEEAVVAAGYSVVK
jgi:copper chaperone CopZ